MGRLCICGGRGKMRNLCTFVQLCSEPETTLKDSLFKTKEKTLQNTHEHAVQNQNTAAS